MTSESAERDLDKLSQRLNYNFKDPDLLRMAFRHSSYVNENIHLDLEDNERLEFLGDAVLDLIISHTLMEYFRDAREGDLSKYRASVVNEKGLYNVAKELDLGAYLLLGKGEEHTSGRKKPSILANTVEALVGAIYLDAGFAVTREIINGLFLPFIKKINSEESVADHKSILQEFTQDKYKTRPDYKLVMESGPAHDKLFKIALYLNNHILAHGEGKSKKEAEQRAAQEALVWVKKEQEIP